MYEEKCVTLISLKCCLEVSCKKKLDVTHILLVVVVLLALLVGHDDTDAQSVKHWVITVGVGWETDGAVSLRYML